MNNIQKIEELQPLDIIGIFEDTRRQIMNGEADPTKVYLLFDSFAKVFDLLKKDSQLKEIFEKEFLKYASLGKEAQVQGFKVRVYDRAVFNYESCGDQVWERLKSEQDALKTNIAAREMFLQSLQGETYDAASEGVAIVPPTKKYTRIIAINSGKKVA